MAVVMSMIFWSGIIFILEFADGLFGQNLFSSFHGIIKDELDLLRYGTKSFYTESSYDSRKLE